MTKPTPISADTFSSLALKAEAEGLLAQLREGTGGHCARTLVKDDAFKLVLVALRAGGTLAEHAAPGPALVLPVLGSLVLRQGREQQELSAPLTDAVLMGPGLRHSVEATSDCALALVIGS